MITNELPDVLPTVDGNPNPDEESPDHENPGEECSDHEWAEYNVPAVLLLKAARRVNDEDSLAFVGVQPDIDADGGA